VSLDRFDLLEYKRLVFELYADVRADPDPAAAWSRWRATRDDLFARHPQSPIPQADRASFRGLPYFDYDPALRATAELSPAPPERVEIATSGEAPYGFTRFATAAFELAGESQHLEVYWLDGYGVGVFVSFRDATSGGETYGAGRYLLDTVKGADLGMEGERLVLDFNFAYKPSCAYDPRWVCPLAPPANDLRVPVRAGELTPPGIEATSVRHVPASVLGSSVMSDEPSRDDALTTISDGEQRVLDLLGRVPPEDLVRPATIGGGDWSAKDLLGHLTSWEELALRSLAEWRSGEMPWTQATEKSVDQVNAERVAARADRSLGEIRAEHDEVHGRLMEALAGISDEEWSQAPPFQTDRPRELGGMLGSVLGAPNAPFGHAFAHLGDLEAFAEAHVPGI
jgi:uncharacterized protein